MSVARRPRRRISRSPERALQIGERTILRRPEPSDAGDFLARARASRALHRNLVQPPLTRPQFARLLRRAEEAAREVHVLCRREDGALCGVINLNEIVRGALQSAYLGYYAFVPYAGQGYMTEGIELVLRQAFVRLALHRLEACVQPANSASIALLARCGFRAEGYSPRLLLIGGRWRDHLRFAIDAEEWRARRRRQARSPAGAAQRRRR
jgi:ribosomal-protein-alanine N-acetyltransferase